MCCFLCLSLSVRVATIADIGRAPTFSRTFTDRVEGRYVTLVIPGSRKIITVCEVEVYGYRSPTGENLSYYMNVNSSSNCHRIYEVLYKPKGKS